MADTLTTNIKLTNQEEGTNLNTWGILADGNFERIDDKFGDVTWIDTFGGDILLNDAQEIVNVIVVTGELSTPANIIFSGRGGTWTIKNKTDGAKPLCCKVAGQAGAIVPAGLSVVVHCDGEDIALSNPEAMAAPEVTVASAVTANILGATSEFINLTGDATISSFGVGPNQKRFVRCSGPSKIKHDEVSLITPTRKDIHCSIGDTFVAVADAASNVRIWVYERVGGRALEPDHDVGDVVWKMRTGPLANHLPCNGLTIGNTGSGATALEGPDAEVLFKILYANYPDAVCPVTGGRGISANSDWLAGKPIALPDGRGRGPFGLDDMGAGAADILADGTPTVAGSGGGAEKRVIAQGNLPNVTLTGNTSADGNHAHNYSYYNNSPAGAAVGGMAFRQGAATGETSMSGNHSHTVSVSLGGASQPLNVMPPYWLGTWYIRYR